MMKTIVIHGSIFSDLESFYVEIDNVLTKNLMWQTGHNLDAFNDILRGGFGVFEYGESIKLDWIDFSKSRNVLEEDMLGKLVGIIKEHDHIDFSIFE